MGESFLFRCAKCSYEVEVSGGADLGESGYVHTAHCRTCRQLVDAVPTTPTLAGAPTDVAAYACPRARSRSHRLVLWTHPGPCPRCGHELNRGPSTALWD